MQLKWKIIMVPSHGAAPICLCHAHMMCMSGCKHKSCIRANSLMPGCQYVYECSCFAAFQGNQARDCVDRAKFGFFAQRLMSGVAHRSKQAASAGRVMPNVGLKRIQLIGNLVHAARRTRRTCLPSWALSAGSGLTAAPAAMAPARFCAYALHRSSMVMAAYLFSSTHTRR